MTCSCCSGVLPDGWMDPMCPRCIHEGCEPPKPQRWDDLTDVLRNAMAVIWLWQDTALVHSPVVRKLMERKILVKGELTPAAQTYAQYLVFNLIGRRRPNERDKKGS